MSLAATHDPPIFGSLIKAWRGRRRFSQLDLALEAEISQRHVSFLESGRAKPSRAAIEKLAGALDLPRSEKDRLFTAAGFVAPSSQTPWGAEARQAIDEALNFILERHDPYPAIVVDRLWNLERANKAALDFFAMFGPPNSRNVIAAFLDPEGPRKALVNWQAAAAHLVGLIEVEVARRLDDADGRALLLNIFEIPGVAEACRTSPIPAAEPALSLHFHVDGRDLKLFSLVATVGMSADPGLDDLKLETLLPADAATRAFFAERAG